MPTTGITGLLSKLLCPFSFRDSPTAPGGRQSAAQLNRISPQQDPARELSSLVFTGISFEDLLQLELPHDLKVLSPCHLGVLHHLDGHHSGKVELEALMEFTSMARNHAYQAQGSHGMLLDSLAEFQAWSMQQLWHKVLLRPEGSSSFVAWMERILEQSDLAHQQDSARASRLRMPSLPAAKTDSQSRTTNGPDSAADGPTAEASLQTESGLASDASFGAAGNMDTQSDPQPTSRSDTSHGFQHWRQDCFRVDTVMALHGLLQAEVLQGISPQAFYELLQCASEEQGLAPLQDEVMDQLIPRPVIRGFLLSLAEGMRRVLTSICPSEE
ncbi:hypothetical protein WJX74_010219 [Apatococcus lobatus]|uniref:Uncharacterized protein n=1 Tax=Apatococcus lobatus TaxID=904363 RepID=A0AAW1S266_9CHLO